MSEFIIEPNRHPMYEPGVNSDTPYDYELDRVPISRGIIKTPANLGEYVIDVEAYDNSVMQERLVRYLFAGNSITTEAEGVGFNIESSLIGHIRNVPEKTYEFATVLRGINPLIDKIEEKIDLDTATEDERAFMLRVGLIDAAMEEVIEHRFDRITSQENRLDLERRHMQEPHLADMRKKFEGRTYPRERGYDWMEVRDYESRIRFIQEGRTKEQLAQRRAELTDPAQQNRAKQFLGSLLNDVIPKVSTQQEAIDLMDAIAIRSDYLQPRTDIKAETLAAAKNAANRILSFGILTSENPLGTGAYRLAVTERTIHNLRRVRHTTGNPPPQSPAKTKMTPVVPITSIEEY